jgi:TRAP-type mannitol/chloroaromatic compound transport system substrate-binding protein
LRRIEIGKKGLWPLSMPALKSGAIDASEWIGPWQDMAIGLHEAARYYYYPGYNDYMRAEMAA